MAPPKKRRSGSSRRAQYGLFVSYVIAVCGIILAVVLMAIARINPASFSAIRGAMLDATTPISVAGEGVARFFANVGQTIDHYFMAASQNANLTRKLKATESKLIKAQAIEYENARLRKLLRLSDTVSDDIANTRIVNSSFISSRRIATIAAGSSSGIQIGMPVRSPAGLIGRVIETGRYASRVLLITDGASNVPVRLVRDGTPALATGRGDGTIDIKALEAGQNPFRRGDILVTSGTGGIYSPNVPAAVVVRATRDETIARPVAELARSDFAIVQSIYMPAANEPIASANSAASSRTAMER